MNNHIPGDLIKYNGVIIFIGVGKAYYDNGISNSFIHILKGDIVITNIFREIFSELY